jgi:prepilin-type processing-associated H-X9-DG protein
MELVEPYRPRAIRCLDVAEIEGWRVKVYGIAYEGSRPATALVDATLAAARATLPSPAVTGERYGVGFLGAHQGRGSNFAFADWWALENELHHHVWFSSLEAPGELRAQRPGDPIACAWDLSVIAHERAAWVEHVLARYGDPDLDGYLAAQLNAEI